MINLIKTIAKELCDYPDDVEVKEIEATESSIIEVRVNKADLGKLIGKHGKTAGAIRTIMYAAAFKHSKKKRYQLEIVNK